MGRYYHGDVEGKFWFAIQSSDDPEFFGAERTDPSYIDYYLGDIKPVKKGLEACRKALGDYFEKIDKFFDENPSYTNERLEKYLDINDPNLTVHLLVWYARYVLGKKIYDFMKEQEKAGEDISCHIEAEL